MRERDRRRMTNTEANKWTGWTYFWGVCFGIRYSRLWFCVLRYRYDNVSVVVSGHNLKLEWPHVWYELAWQSINKIFNLEHIGMDKKTGNNSLSKAVLSLSTQRLPLSRSDADVMTDKKVGRFLYHLCTNNVYLFLEFYCDTQPRI